MDSCLICFRSVPRLTRGLLSAQFLLDPRTVSVTNLFSFLGTVSEGINQPYIIQQAFPACEAVNGVFARISFQRQGCF